MWRSIFEKGCLDRVLMKGKALIQEGAHSLVAFGVTDRIIGGHELNTRMKMPHARWRDPRNSKCLVMLSNFQLVNVSD